MPENDEFDRPLLPEACATTVGESIRRGLDTAARVPEDACSSTFPGLTREEVREYVPTLRPERLAGDELLR